jgi:hypothetical protein
LPLLRYFGVVGPALLMLLLAVNWILPEATPERVHVSTERHSFRISSIEKLPERVVFDTSLPQIAIPPRVILPAIELPKSAFAFVQITPGPLLAFSTLAEVAPKSPIAAKRDPARKMATRRAAPQAHTAAQKNYYVREVQLNAKPPIRTTFLDDFAGRLGQMFKVN